jgi:hypothetical protein
LFAPSKPFQRSLMFVGKDRSLPYSRAPERFFNWEGSCFTSKHLAKACRDKHSCLLWTFVNNGRKKFYNIGPCTINHFTFVINFVSKIARVFVTVRHFCPSLIFVGKAGAYPSSKGWLLTLTANIKLGWNWLTWTNTLIYYHLELITNVKRFIV